MDQEQLKLLGPNLTKINNIFAKFENKQDIDKKVIHKK